MKQCQNVADLKYFKLHLHCYIFPQRGAEIFVGENIRHFDNEILYISYLVIAVSGNFNLSGSPWKPGFTKTLMEDFQLAVSEGIDLGY